MHPGMVGGVLGAVLGVLGGIFGVYCSIKNTGSTRERAFVIRAGVLASIAIIGLLGLLWKLPQPYKYLVWIPYMIVLPLAIRYWNRRQLAIRIEEQQKRKNA